MEKLKKIIFFDTETTGLPVDRNKSVFEYRNNWPDLVSVSWSVFINEGCLRKESYIIRPDRWRIPAESTMIHGITHEYAMDNGVPLGYVLGKFKQDIEGAYKIIAHNLDFDKNVMFNAYLWRMGVDVRDFWDSRVEFCSMLKSKLEMKIPSGLPKGKDPYKFPGLDALYKDTFKTDAPSGAHNSSRDVDVLQKICWARWNLLE